MNTILLAIFIFLSLGNSNCGATISCAPDATTTAIVDRLTGVQAASIKEMVKINTELNKILVKTKEILSTKQAQAIFKKYYNLNPLNLLKDRSIKFEVVHFKENLLPETPTLFGMYLAPRKIIALETDLFLRDKILGAEAVEFIAYIVVHELSHHAAEVSELKATRIPSWKEEGHFIEILIYGALK